MSSTASCGESASQRETLTGLSSSETALHGLKEEMIRVSKVRVILSSGMALARSMFHILNARTMREALWVPAQST